MYKNVSFRDGKKEIKVIPKKGEAMGTCATFNRKYICCRVQVLKSVHNCLFECSYCFLQNYLNDSVTKIVNDIDPLISEVKEKIDEEPLRLFRIGTWELGDSLALEDKTGQAARLVQEFAVLKNAVLELKTKSDCVDSILALDHKGRTVVSWSLNTDYIIKTEEHGTASLEKRIKALEKTAKAGYLIGLHFDPMIYHDGWEKGYKSLIEKVFDAALPDRIAWISIGSLRFNPEMKKRMDNNYPDNRLTCAEMVLGDDAKVRYVKPLRVSMYNFLYKELKQYVTNENLIYLCMERWDVWDKIFGYHPDTIGHLDYFFAKSLYERYGLMKVPPKRELYEEGSEGSGDQEPGEYKRTKARNGEVRKCGSVKVGKFFK
jgi:spore photoproduct lyase